MTSTQGEPKARPTSSPGDANHPQIFNSSWRGTLWVILLAAAATYGAFAAFATQVKIPGRAIMWVIIAAGFVALAVPFVRQGRGRQRRLSIALGTLFAALTVVGLVVSKTLAITKLIGSGSAILTSVITTLTLACAYALALDYVLTGAMAGEGFAANRPDRFSFFTANRRSLLVVWLAVAIAWLPYYLVMFPGSMSTDSINQIRQVIGELPLSNHHPVVHTALIALFVAPANAAGNLTVGVALYSAFQLLALAATVSVAIWYLAKRGVGQGVRLAVLVFVALVPTNGLYSVTMWKDVPFACLAILMTIFLFEIARSPRLFFHNRLLVSAFIVTAFFFCIFRNNGVYAFVLFAIVAAIVLKSVRARVLIASVVVLVLFAGYWAVIFGALHAKSSSMGETLSVPLQQIARAVRDHGDDLSVREKETIREVLPQPNLGKVYDPEISNHVKSHFLDEAFSKDRGKYAKLWFDLGMRYPATYLAAFLCENYGYWYPDADRRIAFYEGPTKARDNGLDVERPVPQMQSVGKNIAKLVTKASHAPIVSAAFSIGFAVWLVLLSAAVFWLKRQRRMLLPFVLLGALWLTTLASPVFAEYRYLYGLILAMPFCVAMALAAKDKSRR